MDHLRLLVVEDSRADADLVQELLSESPEAAWEVAWVRRLSDALDQLAASRFDAVLLDLGLPDTEGLEGVRLLCRRFPGVAVVVLTGVDDSGVGLLALHEGAQDYLSKSRVDADLLSRALRYAVERRRLQAAYEESQRLYHEILQNSLALICTHDLQGTVLSVNPAAAQALGCLPEELVGRSLAETLAPEVRGQFGEYLERIRTQGLDTGLMRVVTKDGRQRIWSYRNVRQDPVGRPSYVIGSALDLTEQIEYEHQLRELGLRDPLTGCFNRRYLERYEAEAASPWGCVFVDLDHFKSFNDIHGHRAGDDVLIQMGRFLGSHLRPGDAVVRLGGDEFLVLLCGVDPPALEAVVGRLQAEAAANAPASSSLGWAVQEGDEPLARAIERADRKMLVVKTATRRYDRPRPQPPMEEAR